MNVPNPRVEAEAQACVWALLQLRDDSNGTDLSGPVQAHAPVPVPAIQNPILGQDLTANPKQGLNSTHRKLPSKSQFEIIAILNDTDVPQASTEIRSEINAESKDGTPDVAETKGATEQQQYRASSHDDSLSDYHVPTPPQTPTATSPEVQLTSDSSYKAYETIEPQRYRTLVAEREEVARSIARALKPQDGLLETDYVRNRLVLKNKSVAVRRVGRHIKPAPAPVYSMWFISKRSASQRINLSQRAQIRLSRQEFLTECALLVRSAVSRTRGDELFSPLDDNMYPANLASTRTGIPEQLAFPENAVVHQDLKAWANKWTTSRPSSDAFFRLYENTSDFSLAELRRAIEILTSRPPRRINYFAARCIDNHSSKRFKELDCPVSKNLRIVYKVPPTEECELNPELKTRDGLNRPYHPTYVCGSGTDRMAWCENCPRGGFFRIKNSTYLYHKNHDHGIFSNGNVFEDPLVIRPSSEKNNLWEGLCGTCYRWIDMDQRDPLRMGTWFRHYNNCTREYDHLKRAVLRTGADVEFIEIEFKPWVTPAEISQTGNVGKSNMTMSSK